MKNQPAHIPLLLITANVFTVSSLIFAQPVLEILANFPEFFVANHLTNTNVYMMLFALIVVIPAALMVPILAATVLGTKVRSYVAAVIISLLAFAVFLRIIGNISALPAVAAVTAAALVAGGFGALYLFNPRLSTTLGWLTPIVIAIPAMFLLNGNVREFLNTSGAPNIEDIQGRHSIENHPPIVFVVWDELPTVDLLDVNGNIDARRFPNFHEFASEATWYENASTVWITTFGALPAMLTGNHPTTFLPRYSSYPKNLFTLVEGAYELNVHESITQLNPPHEQNDPDIPPPVHKRANLRTLAEDLSLVFLHVHLPRAYTERLPQIDGQWGGFLLREDRQESANQDTPGDAPPSDEQNPFLESLTEEERAAFQESFLDSMTEEERAAFHEAYAERLRNDKAARMNFARQQQRLMEEQQLAIQEHFSGSRKNIFDSFIGSIQDFPKNSLHFVHIGIPHPPSVYLPSGDLHTPPDEYQAPLIDRSGNLPAWTSSQTELDNAHHRLRLQIGFADTLLGSLMTELRRLEIYDESLIIICSDHGGSFLHGQPRRIPTRENLGDVAFVPLMIKYPGQSAPERSTENVEIIDILPTIVDVLSAELDWTFDGRSLLDPTSEPRTTKVLPPNKEQTNKVEYTPTEYMTAKRKAHNRNIETFSLRDSRSDLFTYGRSLDFLGMNASALKDLVVDGEILSEDVARLTNTGPLARPLYSGIQGSVNYDGSDAGQVHVAVLVNDTVQAVVPVYESRGELRFEAILPEKSFSEPTHRVTLLLLSIADDKA